MRNRPKLSIRLRKVMVKNPGFGSSHLILEPVVPEFLDRNALIVVMEAFLAFLVVLGVVEFFTQKLGVKHTD